MRRALWSVALAGLAIGTVLGQPPVDDKPAQARDAQAQPQDDRAALKARLDRWLADNKHQQERLEAAIKKFESGAPLPEVRSELDSARLRQGDQNRGPRAPGARGPGDQGPDHGPPPPAAGKMSREEVLDFLNKEFPEIGKRFQDANKDNPGITARILDRMEPNIREIIAERDPDMKALRRENFENGFEVMRATREFIEAHRKEPQADATKEKADKLRTLLGTHFDLQIKLHKQEIVILERRIKQLRDELEKQPTDRQQFIEKRIEDLMNRPPRNHQEREPHPTPPAATGSEGK
jgi:hypothetical protein